MILCKKIINYLGFILPSVKFKKVFTDINNQT